MRDVFQSADVHTLIVLILLIGQVAMITDHLSKYLRRLTLLLCLHVTELTSLSILSLLELTPLAQLLVQLLIMDFRRHLKDFYFNMNSKWLLFRGIIHSR